MIARAPGKLVLSGAYSVLEGAPAIVAAVDRYVTADASRPADLVTDEVRAAIEAGAIDRAPWFDASPLRELAADGTSRKLGLGSSAAILVASMAAVIGDRVPDAELLRATISRPAHLFHRRAQGGGSGIDVAASVHGGVIVAEVKHGGEVLVVDSHALPTGVVVEVWASPVASSTRALLAQVRALAEADPASHRACLDAAAEGARAAVAARSIEALVKATAAQTDALGALGEAAGAPIVTAEVAALRELAEREGGTFAPSGAGGGDIAFFLGAAASGEAFRSRAAALGLARIDATIGAPGVARALFRGS